MEEKPLRSPLSQGGLEIKCSVTCNWTDAENLELLTQLIEKNYQFDNRMTDDSKSILESLDLEVGIGEYESDDEEDSGLPVEIDDEIMEVDDEVI